MFKALSVAVVAAKIIEIRGKRVIFDKDLANVLNDFKDYRQSLGYGATLKAQLANVRPQGVFFTQNDIKAFVVIDGKLGLDISQ